MLLVSWRYVILSKGTFSGRRVKRRTMGGDPLPVISSDVYPKGPQDNPNVWSPNAPKTLSDADGNTYLFAFWSLKPLGFIPPAFVPIQATRSFALNSPANQMATIDATAWYVWDFGVGGGEHGIAIDAFDIDAGDFLADDFVDVAPDPTGGLTKSANEGWLNTSTQVGQGQSVTISARDQLPSRKFAYWLEIEALTSGTPPAVNGHDIVAHHADIMVAFGLYNHVERPIRISRYEYFDPFWWIETHGGLTPPGPPDPFGPWLPQFAAALALADTAKRVSPRLRRSVLEVALEQISIAAGTLKKDIKKLKNE